MTASPGEGTAGFNLVASYQEPKVSKTKLEAWNGKICLSVQVLDVIRDHFVQKEARRQE